MTPLQETLKKYLNQDGIRWSKTYDRLSPEHVQEMIDKYKERARKSDEDRRHNLEKQLSEPDEKELCGPVGSAYEFSTGGGTRVIRSTRNLGG